MDEQPELFDGSETSDRPPQSGGKQCLPQKDPSLEHHIYFGDNLRVMRELANESIDLIYVDPPFNTGAPQTRQRIKTDRAKEGELEADRGFGGHRYYREIVSEMGYDDQFENYLRWLTQRLLEARRVLSPTGSIYLHLDWREIHHARILMDRIFGAENFINEIIWAYDFGGRSKKRWPRKHDNILFYAKDEKNYTFNREAVDRIPYMAPGLQSEERRKRGKFPTDTWWHTVVGTNSNERTGYPTQKPVGVLRRIVAASSQPSDRVLDFCAGSGSLGEACLALGREFHLIDNNPEALEVMKTRFSGIGNITWHDFSNSS